MATKRQKYISTFISGIQKPIEMALNLCAEKVEVVDSMDGLITYETDSKIEDVANLRFFNNTFYPLKEFTKLHGDVFKPMVQWAVRHDYPEQVRALLKKYGVKSFRVVMVKDNTIVGYNPGLIKDIQYKLVHTYKLNIDKSKPDAEFWFYVRNDGYGFYGLRITNTSRVEHRNKGQLRPEIASIMCEISEIHPTDVVLDPFLGYGTILYERSYHLYEKLLGYEINKEVFSKIRLSGENVEIHNESFFRNELEDKSISKIITDPPWGSHEKLDNNYYTQVFEQFKRLLSEDGIVVLLVSRELEDEFNNLFNKFEFEVKEKYEILVSGRKATIFKAKHSKSNR